jgi:ceramide glucosyltransferase
MDWAGASPVSIGLFALAIASLAYLSLALWHVSRFSGPKAMRHDGQWPSVTVMKPLCGGESGLYDCLRSFCRQDYPVFQMVFGVREADDQAIEVVERLRAEFPDQDISLVVNDRLHGANLKVSNLINMMPECRYDILVIADSDVAAEPDTLLRVVSQLAEPRVGATSCLYRGQSMVGFPSRLGALYINDWFLPSVLVDFALNGVDGCFGALMAVRREALLTVGGFRAVVDHLAEDNMLGRLIRLQGWRVCLNPCVVDTMVGENSLSSLIAHEVRWGRTVRACRATDHFLSLVTFPLPLLLILLALAPSRAGVVLIALHLGLRLALHYAVGVRMSGFGVGRPLDAVLIPLRESLCFLVWAISLLGNGVRWRGREYRIIGDGRLLAEDSAPNIRSHSFGSGAMDRHG